MRSVAYVLAEYPTPTQTWVHFEMVGLQRLGFDVRLVVHQAGPPGVRFGAGPDGVPLTPAHVGLATAGPTLAATEHLHGHLADFGIRVLAPLAERAGRPFSFTVHGGDLFRRADALRVEEWRDVARRTTRIVAISRFHRDWMVARGVPAEKIAVIPNAAALGELLASAPPAPTRLRRVLAVGRPAPRKGFGVLVQAWNRARRVVPDLQLDIIGGDGLVDRPPRGLRLWPLRDWELVVDAIRAADLVVAPSVVSDDGEMDGLPGVLVEAAALRRPVIASRLAGVGDLVAHGVNGLLVPPGDIAALAEALVRLATRPEEAARLGDAGPLLAAPHDADVVARRLAIEAFAA